ncbi:hypothetical protein CSB93_5697 [Pseudomonas paraeruginosa]|uniref:Uncharacterized protein n=1 Tax=Pseudomonas paraeruginosa TaxID=2994495 RepID=A0A2R3IVL7_9PSED|nr:hypothetical protein CSB93_5697 [Pseudomonas paraeruginosa]AWE94024.1 hypothetical protein CSC28_4496 [Pseudomonas paraeruginosa]PTC35717.1 hypothetical protein CLJ1_4417 [Pseudomonas aeruginosa]
MKTSSRRQVEILGRYVSSPRRFFASSGNLTRSREAARATQ